MFDKEPKQVTLGIAQDIQIDGWCIAYLGKRDAGTCVFTCPARKNQIYVPIDGVFYSGGTKIKIVKVTDQDVTLGWEG